MNEMFALFFVVVFVAVIVWAALSPTREPTPEKFPLAAAEPESTPKIRRNPNDILSQGYIGDGMTPSEDNFFQSSPSSIIDFNDLEIDR